MKTKNTLLTNLWAKLFNPQRITLMQQESILFKNMQILGLSFKEE